MNSRSSILLVLVTLIVFSSGCIGGQGSEADLVKEGNRLTYDSPGHGNTTFTFFNETEDTIEVREASGGTVNFYTVYRENLTSLGEEDFMIGSPNRYTENTTKREKIRSLMEEGGSVNIYEGSEKVLEVRRTDKATWNGVEAYKVVFEGEPVTYRNLVTAEPPYLLLNSSSSRGKGLTLEKVERNVDIDMSDYRNQEGLNAEEEISANVKASSTELEFSSVYSTENEEGDRRISLIIENTGERDIDPGDFEVKYSTDRYTDFRAFGSLDEMWKTGENGCINYSGNVKPSGSFQCHTGLAFPGPEREVGIRIESKEFDYETAYTCEPATEDARTC